VSGEKQVLGVGNRSGAIHFRFPPGEWIVSFVPNLGPGGLTYCQGPPFAVGIIIWIWSELYVSFMADELTVNQAASAKSPADEMPNGSGETKQL